MSDTFHDLLLDFAAESYEFGVTGRAPRSHLHTAKTLTEMYDEQVERVRLLEAKLARQERVSA